MFSFVPAPLAIPHPPSPTQGSLLPEGVATARRIACLFVPDFQIHVVLRDLGGEPAGGLALVDPEDGRRRIVAASPGARVDGVRRGMTAIAASAVAPELTVRELDRGALAAAHTRLEAAVRSVTPVFESTGSGVLYASFAGLDLRYAQGGEGGFLDDLREAATGLGLPARTGMAGTRFCARAAAVMEGKLPGYGSLPIRVEPGKEQEFLAPLPVELLPCALDVVGSLRRLGIRTLGAFAALPPPGVARRLGQDGLALHRLARGEDRGTLVFVPEGRRFLVRASAEYPIVQAEALRFLLRRPLERLVGELDHDGLAARCLRWTMELDGAEPLAGRTWSASPSASLRLWNDLWKVEMERLRPDAGVIAVELEAEDVCPRPAEQERLTGPRAAPPGAMSITLAHLAAELGPDGFGTLRPRPDPWPERRQRAEPFVHLRAAAHAPPEPWVPDRARRGELSVALRRVDPPEAVQADLRGGRIAAFQHAGGWLQVRRALGPWEVTTGWWEEGGGIRRLCFQVEGQGHAALLYREEADDPPPAPSGVGDAPSVDPAGDWFLAGWLD